MSGLVSQSPTQMIVFSLEENTQTFAHLPDLYSNFSYI